MNRESGNEAQDSIVLGEITETARASTHTGSTEVTDSRAAKSGGGSGASPPISNLASGPDFEQCVESILALPPIDPWPEPVNGAELLQEIQQKISRHVVLPRWAPETMALWVPHTFAFHHRDITTYLGIESPEHRCGKSTLITILSELTQRAVVASNVTAPSFFRVIAQLLPTLFIDEADTFLAGNDELKGILNSSYFKKTAFVLRAVNLPGPIQTSAQPLANSGVGYNPGILRFSCWCPKLIARIGALPPTLADRCIVFRLHRKTSEDSCERLRKFDPGDVKRKCLRFVLDHAAEIAAAEPHIPGELNDRAADVWEPLFVIADLAGGPWPAIAREAAVGLGLAARDSNPIGVLLFDVFMQFSVAETDRMFSSELVERLNAYPSRPWKDLLRGRPVDDRWLARQLSPYGIRSRNLRIDGMQAKGYYQEDMTETVRRYVPKAEVRVLLDEMKTGSQEPSNGATAK